MTNQLVGETRRAPSWSYYIRRFHAERPGITERILARCTWNGIDPYQWCAEAIGTVHEPVLDIACGSAPMAAHVRRWVGADASDAELQTAARLGRGPVLRASATQLPVRAHRAGAVVCTMALQVIEPLAAAITEAARVLRPGGRAVLLLPATGPLPRRQAAVYLRLQLALRQRIRYPNDELLHGDRLAARCAEAGLFVTSIERRCFSLPIRSADDVDELLRSLYLPTVDARRHRRARRVLARRIGTELAVPLRRVVLDRAP